ncbi:putative disease resistance protein RGA3 [Chenopodium quinoa]|uniref:putative disease resistance protein RGA3 n=1 Tax=Chenopodium quinoa TaxID=63459 RepID=UPI000B76D2E2|nr:putative disease resistance protein RGA3 [Chenopodium quinoa]
MDCATKNHNDFGFSKLYKPVKIREKTCSYVFENDIIGRDADKKIIVDVLLKDDLEENISFATIVGTRGLEKDSWELFKKISLREREDVAVIDLVEIGKEITKNCVNVPLSIRVVASLLYNQDIAIWQSFGSIDLAKLGNDDDDIMPTLMFSYYHLAPELKSCFSYCSLFPED